ncbi:hypothetical protein L873DRAFT_1849177 [Choiromyces venosus 120613-1]|uniref:Uncharacterized protein n=1 Tax=Choiromyces venosus 120613-1 TaxID=1336337 RepID=A0A3N4IV99_9PEZI|nr:hypothetical protein L873DRAFT_1849177 [Choiromyces venosus 120613-1]
MLTYELFLTGSDPDDEVSSQDFRLDTSHQKHWPVRTVQAHLQGLSKVEKALQVEDMLNLYQPQGEVLAIIVAHVWENYVVPEKLWEDYHGRESRFKEDVAYNEFIAPILQSVKVSQSWKNKQISRLESCWGAGWEKTIDVHTDHLSILSEHYLQNMAKIASSGMTLLDAQLILQHVIKTRISHPTKGVRAQGIIMVSDIKKVVSAVSAVSRSQNIEPEECSPMQLITFLAAEAAGAHRVTELDTPQITQNSPPPAILPPPGVVPFTVMIPTKTPSQGSAGSPTPHRLLSPSPTPLSKHSWSLIHVDAHRVITARPFSKDLSGSPTNQVPLAIESTALLLMQSQALPDILHWKIMTLHKLSRRNRLDPTTGSAGLASNLPSPMPPAQSRARKRRYIDYTSGPDGISQPYHFKLPDNWADCSPIGPALHRDGFYKMQQALVQSPYVYLVALAAMETTNHRLISLPVPLIIFPGSPGSPLMDSTFPFAKYIQSDKKVPGTRLLYSLDDANIRIGTSSSTEEVKEWWDMSGSDLKVAAHQLPGGEFSTTQLLAGELIAMPPKLLWTAETYVPKGSSSSATTTPTKFLEVRFIPVTPKAKLDFNYWPHGTLDHISHCNRDLRAPTVTGWGTESLKREKRFKTAIEMRGVWAIGDALLGLMSWRSPLVQLELCQLFVAPTGNWFNMKFAAQIQTRFDEKLSSMVETLELLHQ